MNLKTAKEYLNRLQFFGIKLGLENVKILLAALGSPEKRFPSVLIAGTNGKGSVAAMLSAALEAEGYRTGLYTSPHLVRVEERFKIGSRLISSRAFCGYLERVKGAIDGLMAEGELIYHPTFFEVLTSVAFLYFSESNVDIAVIEVGLGGRFDATNVLNPLFSVITTISLDHEKHLGHTLAEIAFEKAGIIKEKTTVVCGVRNRQAFQVIKKRALEMDAPFVRVFGPGKKLEFLKSHGKYRFSYSVAGEKYSFVPALAGRHQGHNAAVAISAGRILDREWRPLSKASMIRGISQARWEGRLETVSGDPLVILDGAHNEEGAASLARYIKDFIRRPVVLVFAAMKDKNIGKMSELLFPLAAAVVATRVPYKRSAEPAEIAAAVRDSHPDLVVESDTRKAVKIALQKSGRRLPVIIAGSLFLVGEVKRLKIFPPAGSGQRLSGRGRRVENIVQT